MKNKKGVSIMIGYILLVAAAVVMGVIVYQWIKTYVPKETIECPGEVSIFIKNYTYAENELILEFQNNGKFSIAGYFIRVKNDSAQKVAAVDLSDKLIEIGNEKIYSNAVLFLGNEENTFEPGDEKIHKFDLTDIGEVYLVEISPARFQEEDNRKKFVNCGNSKVEEVISESAEEPPETCGDEVCNPGECDSCPQDCTHSECCGDGTCNNGETCGETDNEPECNSDCGICERTQITFIDFENSNEINNWEEDPSQSVYGETLVISGTNECSPKGSYMLSGTGNFDPNLVRYKRTAIDVTGYGDIKISGSVASEDTESYDRIEFHYYTGSSWETCYQAVNRNGYTCAGWEDFECDVNLNSGETDLVIGVAWETSATNEHAFWDNINITGLSI